MSTTATAARQTPVRRPKFSGSKDFHTELRRRVRAYLEECGQKERDCPRMYAKTGILLASFAATWVALVFFASTWWTALPLALLLGICTAAIGFNVQHDGGHHGYSELPWVNRWMARTMDVIGASSYLWHWKHGVYHHTYTNIDGHDDDIALWEFGRLSPQQKRRPWHRFQHFYLWALYGVQALKWHLYDDFVVFATGRMGPHKIPRPKGKELVGFWLGKAAFFSWAMVIPMMIHPFWTVVLYGGIASVALGFILSVVFQLAHVVEEAEFPSAEEIAADGEQRSWARHQVETTVNFARGSKVLTFLLGGLNFQVEHHLFPRICHVNYPRIAPVVEQTCRDFGVRYRAHKTMWSAIASHYRWLRQMSRRPENAAA